MPMLSPLSPDQWDRTKAAHLLNRAGFGGAPAHIDSLAACGMAASVKYLVDGPVTPDAATPPDWAKPRDLLAIREQVKQAEMNMAATGTAADVNKKDARKQIIGADIKTQFEHMGDLVGWWLERMRQSQDALEEKMTLYWHGHFATSAQKVKDGYLMWLQNQTFRSHARGNFGVLVKAMTRDPAMIDWLDLRESRAQHPNENFAREVMELFTLGEGNYTEKDVTQGARAFTGYRINPLDESFHFAANDHDNAPKEFLGRSDVRNGDEAVDAILAQPACARYLGRKLWTFFAYENPSDALVNAVADSIRANHYEMRPVLHKMFTSQEFYSAAAMGTQIKSPVQWLVQSSRELEITLPDRGPMIGALRQMGQVPFNPPSVKGWDGGRAWISTSTLLTRYNFAGVLLGNAPRPAPASFLADNGNSLSDPPGTFGGPAAKPDLAKLAPAPLRDDPKALVGALTNRLFRRTPSDKEETAFLDYLKSTAPTVTDGAVSGLLHLMMSTPQFQLC